MENRPLSGEQYVLSHRDHTAIVADVGASVRSYTHAGRRLVLGYEASELRPDFRGATLAPWPNRVTDGRYTFAGAEHRLALTEPERGHALHGLVLWQRFEIVGHAAARRLRLAATIEPQQGYPWRVRVETTYTLDDAGLTQSVRATNLSDSPAPFGTGPHPYLVAGEGVVDDWTLALPADQVLLTDDRLVPARLAPVTVDRARFDFRIARAMGDVRLDHAFTGLPTQARVQLTAPDGRGVTMAWGPSCRWVQLHTADGLSRTGLAVEPMTCAPDAFNSADWETGLTVLQPGSSTEASWTISPLS